MWTYHQKTGELSRDGKHFAWGYAGHGEGKNNPALQAVHDVGPIPRGKYTMGHPYRHPSLGPSAIPLTPDKSNEMCGRTGFYLHSDSAKHPGEASHGCIVCAQEVRERMWVTGDYTLEVVE